MAVPRSKEARRFYRAGQARREEAGVLLAAGYATGAVYLGGYAVECTLKSLLLATIPQSQHEDAAAAFRGNRGHDLQHLRARYTAAGGATIPPPVASDLAFLSRWSTALRYSAKATPDVIARDYFAAADRFLTWADGRL